MIDRLGRQVGQRHSALSDPRLAGIYGSDDGVGIRDIEVVDHQNHPVRGVQVIEEGGAQIRLAVPVDVAQQRNAVAAWRARPLLRGSNA